MWTYLIVLVVGAIVTYALTPKPPVPKPATLSDINVPTAEEGRAIPWIAGEGWLMSYCVVWFGDLGTVAIKKKTGK